MNSIKTLCKYYSDQSNNQLFKEFIEQCYMFHKPIEEAINNYPATYFKELGLTGVVGLEAVFLPKGTKQKDIAGYYFKLFHKHMNYKLNQRYIKIDDIKQNKKTIYKRNIDLCEAKILMFEV